MGGITHAGFMYKKDGISMVWRKLWFEVKGTRLTYFQRDDTSSLFNRSVSKRGQIKLEEVDDVRRSQASDAESTEIEIIDNQVRDLPLPILRAAPLLLSNALGHERRAPRSRLSLSARLSPAARARA